MQFSIGSVLAGLLLLTSSACESGADQALHRDGNPHTAERQADVAARSAEVMPFDLERTTHVFEDGPHGGLQQVVAKDAADREQIALIRAHLREEADRFSLGDYGDPAHIHGENMPGLRELVEGARRIEVRFEEVPEGGQIHYTTADTSLVQAIHHWFAAQRRDHGRHASPQHR